jgi:predicted transcriptional regulator of viral defense system
MVLESENLLKALLFFRALYRIALMMKAASTSKTSANFYQNIRRNNPENSHLHTRRRENLRSHIVQYISAKSKA